METKVINLKGTGQRVLKDPEVYIGRSLYMGGWRLPGSPLANPFKVDSKCKDSRSIAIQQYETMIRSRPDLMELVRSLKGKTLCCWCKPLPCHGDVLLKIIAEFDDKKSHA